MNQTNEPNPHPPKTIHRSLGPRHRPLPRRPIDQRPNHHPDPLLDHHHQRRAKHPPRQLRPDPLIQPPHSPVRKLLHDHLGNGRFDFGIAVRALQHDLGAKVGVGEHGGDDAGDHAEEECLGGGEGVVDVSLSVGFGLDAAGGDDDFFDLFVDRVLDGGFEAEDGVGLDSFVEASDALLAQNVGHENKRPPVLVIRLNGGGDAIDGQRDRKMRPFGHASQNEVGRRSDVVDSGDVHVPILQKGIGEEIEGLFRGTLNGTGHDSRIKRGDSSLVFEHEFGVGRHSFRCGVLIGLFESLLLLLFLLFFLRWRLHCVR
mmetsp:Transcript_28095/g.56200  ORF Transcript_28095/g.56200 Transcript_28095/m.56200 type:complete len:315 (+) Transcript_28095:424-1368(+)